jgi:very-short-patch-repair endonuclease
LENPHQRIDEVNGAGGLNESTMDSHYNKNLKEKAQYLRTHSTPGEIILWNKVLKNKKMHGFQFLRQYSLENYIVDFICRKARLIIEIDGYSHNFKYAEDLVRDERLTAWGYSILRFQEKDVLQDLNNIIRSIEQYLANLKN